MGWCQLPAVRQDTCTILLILIRIRNFYLSLKLTLKVLARKALHRKNTKEARGPN